MNEKIIDKIKKCLALSESPNEHEATIALIQAQKLMLKYNINDLEISMSNINESHILSSKKLDVWHKYLLTTCGNTFGCAILFYKNIGKIKIVGPQSSVELTEYAYNVLLKKIRKSRRNFSNEILNNKGLNSYGKKKLLDGFSLGWVDGVASKITKLKPNQNVYDYIQSKFKKINNSTIKVPKLSENQAIAVRIGINEGKEVDIYSPVNNNSKDLKLTANK